MSNTRRARGTKTPDARHSWAEETCIQPLPVRGAWTASMSGPVVWADATGHLDITDLARGHREAPEGAVFTQWMFGLYPSTGVRVLLLVRFTRPVRTEFAGDRYSASYDIRESSIRIGGGRDGKRERKFGG